MQLLVPLRIIDADRAPASAQLVETRAGQLGKRDGAERVSKRLHAPLMALHAVVGAVLLIQREGVGSRHLLAREALGARGRVLGKAGRPKPFRLIDVSSPRALLRRLVAPLHVVPAPDD